MRSRRLLGVFLAVLFPCQLVAVAARWDGSVERAAAERNLGDRPATPAPDAPADGPGVAPPTAPEQAPQAPLVGAHYHVWYPTNFDQGYLRGRLDPPQQPALGRYRSDDPRVAEQQIEWASGSGIDFFTLDWWPSRPEQNATALSGFLEADNIGDIDFAVFYEVWDLGFDAATEATEMDPATIERFVDDMETVATTFFDHPSYLRVGGRPVVIMYLSRTMTGDVVGAITQVRQRMAELGHDVLLIGDEIFWRTPQPERMRLFDAITSYNLYAGSDMPQHRGYASETPLVEDHLGVYRQFADAVGGEVPIVPHVIPGYNDRGVRPSLAHYAIPRRWAEDLPEGSLLREMIDRVVRQMLDPRLPMWFITSWNEWNEDTAIEPLADASETSADASDTDTMFSDGYAYGGGPIQLEALRDEIVAVAGSVRDGRRPVSGVRVEARDLDRRLLAADVTDSAGRFTLSRWLLTGGDVLVSSPDGEEQVRILPDETVEVALRA